MASANPKQQQQHQQSRLNPSLIQKLRAVGQPRFSVFEQWRLAGVPPPETESLSSSASKKEDALEVPETIQDVTSIKLYPESVAAKWLTTQVQRTEDITLSRIPSWAVEGVTTCIFPNVVVLRWPPILYGPVSSAETSCLRVVDIRGKGKGCVAARTVPRGESVARERALLVMPRTCVSPRQFVRDATNLMTPSQRAAFFALQDCKSAELRDLMGIISTNSFLIPGVPNHSVLYSGVFEIFSRINHSCCPNAMFRWDHATFSGEIRALRPISEGEEVTISYFQDIIGPTAATQERQKFLLQCYNFKCACLICGRPSAARSRSEEDRPIISVTMTNIGKYYREMVQDWITNGGNDHARLLVFLHVIEGALDREMIFHPKYWIYLARVIVMVRCALREAKAARRWAQRAAQHTRAATGSDGGWDAIAKEPEKCGWWGLWDKPRLRGIWV